MKELPVLNTKLLQQINPKIARFYNVIPKDYNSEKLTLWLSDGQANNLQGLEKELELILGKKVSFELLSEKDISILLSKYYQKEKKESKYSSKGNFVDEVIFDAFNAGVSDIHIEIYSDEARIRFRIDGKLLEHKVIDLNNYLELINQVKIKSNLDITEKRLPQDGRIEYEEFDIRVSVLPTHYGEKAVLRILGRDASNLSLIDLGFSEEDFKVYTEGIKNNNGIILISGPTGSGKTTTLYASLKSLNDIDRNISTIEDPIEYTLKGINQVQLKESIGFGFVAALKSFLRQDPDIIMVGEIRDSETAQMAIRASLTGHLVFSTIHTNSALGTISRLIDMGVPPFLIADTLKLSIAQRLIRKLCENCKKKVEIANDSFPNNFRPPFSIEECFEQVGCEECSYTGYNGRQAIYEIVNIEDEIAESIKVNKISEIKIKDSNKLSYKAFGLLKEGVTSLDEVYSLLITS